MAAESILTYKKPGFPTFSNDGKEHTTEIEYIGPYSTLLSAAPSTGATWGDYIGIVTSESIEPIGGTSPLLGELRITVGYQFDLGTSSPPAGDEQETTYEVEWVSIQRSMYEHPEFAVGLGGAYALTSEDITAIEAWKNEENVSEKKLFKYKATPTSETFTTLSTNAKMFARGVQLGVETWDDYAPVVRVTTAYINGKPPQAAAGHKNNPPTAAGGPSGYEWRKSAERSIKTGRQNRWERVEEWLGAKKVLVDKDDIFWTAP